MDDLYSQIETIRSQLDKAVAALGRNADNMALKEMEYKMLVTTETLKLRDQGIPVTLIDRLVQGDPNVAQAKREWVIAEAKYNQNQDAINSYKLQLRLLDNQVNREWNQSGGM